MGHAGIVHQYVDAAVAIDRLLNQLVDVLFLPDIRHATGPGPCLRDLLDLVAIDVADHKPGTLRGEAFGDGEPDTLGGSGDDGDLVIQLHFSAPKTNNRRLSERG